MAEQIPYGVAASLVNRLASAAFRELGRIYGVVDELERLKKTIDFVRAVLLDAEEKQEKNHAIRIWIRRLKDDVLHPADNLLDEFLIEDTRHKMDKARKNKVTKVFSSLSPNRIAFRHKIAHEIEKIQKNINDVKKDMSGLNLNSNVVVVEKTNCVRRETSSFVFESDIIGREDDRNEIISLLMQPHGDQNVSMIAIVGIGGLGKTTLAQLVYNDDEVTNYFEKCMWICVSDNFDVKTIVKKMLELLTNDKIDDKLSLEHLQNMLREKINAKRYFLVLDDIWNESYEKWAQLRNYLMCGAHGSKVVVTTRSKIVAQTMGVSDPYVLNGLTTEESWDLLKNIITYGYETKEVNRALESIGKKIAEKCTGVPLAVRTLGGLLQGKSEEKAWLDVLNDEFWKLCENEESIMSVLKLSYQNLSPQLRQCFAFCSLYPKDWEINKDELIQMWMAQGYLDCSDETQLMEDIGNQFVNIFLMKSFFQDAHVDDRHGEIYSFKMHDLIHDLAMQVAGGDCCYLDSETKRLIGSPVHVMLESDDIGLLESLDSSRVRTLIFQCTHSVRLNENELSVISKFKYLRILRLSNCNVSKMCDLIGKLKHLRYLNLRLCKAVRSLLRSTINIVCLQTLSLFECEDVEFSTKDISNLINLRHFIFANGKAYKGKNTMLGFEKLGVKMQYKEIKFSKWLTPLTNIIGIHLFDCQSLRYLPPMERLPFLKSLVIASLHELEYIYYEQPLSPKTFFPSLEYLNINQCEKLRGWWRMWEDVNDDDNSSQSFYLSFFPSLSFLSIVECPMLTRMPTFPNLGKRLEFHNCNMDILETTLNMVTSKCSIEFPPLSMLKHLELGTYGLDVTKLRKDWVQSLTSLEHLVIYKLSNQTSQEIEIWFKDDLNYLPSLQNIELHNCEDIKALPDWICKLSSLQHVKIVDCQNLALLPEGISSLAKLNILEIIQCPLLIEEYEIPTGATMAPISATMAKTAHIPNIILKRDYW